MTTPRTVGDVIGGLVDKLARHRAAFADDGTPVSLARGDLALLVEAARKTLPPPLPETRTAPVVAPTDAAYAPLATLAERLTVRTGDVIAVEMDDGMVRAFVVRHPAWQLPGNQWVIAIGNVPGGYDLARVRAKKVTTNTEHGGN